MGSAQPYRILEGIYQGTHQSHLQAGPSRTWTTFYAIRSTTSADPRGFSTGPSLGRLLQQGHPPLDPPGYATLRVRGPEQRLGALEDSEADGCWRTKQSNGHVMLSC
jgi:hypothetical protein